MADQNDKSNAPLRWLMGLMFSGLPLAFFYSLGSKTLEQTLEVFAVLTFLAGASMFGGGLLGFLFGIPRTVISPNDESTVASGKRFQTNTNLEQISDWLTKILVGVGLTQISNAEPALRSLVRDVAPSIGTAPSAKLLIVTIVVAYAVCGFGTVYIWMRLHFHKLLQQAELDLELRIRESMERSAEARAMLHESLSPSTDSPQVDPKRFAEALKAAAPDVRVSAFMQARQFRQDHWKLPDGKKLINRVIPVFQALLAADTKEIERHRLHGQLAYAFKDQEQEDLPAALDQVNRAIRLRDESNGKGTYQLYELTRAHCRVLMELRRAQTNPGPTPPETAKLIHDDLKQLVNPGIIEIRRDMKEIAEWESRNPKPEQ